MHNHCQGFSTVLKTLKLNKLNYSTRKVLNMFNKFYIVGLKYIQIDLNYVTLHLSLLRLSFKNIFLKRMIYQCVNDN